MEEIVIIVDGSNEIQKDDFINYKWKLIKCDKCNQRIPRCRIDIHTKVHLEKPFQCSYCMNSFKSNANLHRHLNSHYSETYKCDYCNKSFRSYGRLERHAIKCEFNIYV